MIKSAISCDYFTILPHFLTTGPHRMVKSTYHHNHNYIIFIKKMYSHRYHIDLSISPTFLTTVSE